MPGLELTGANLLEKVPWYASCTEVVSCSVGRCVLSHGSYHGVLHTWEQKDAISNWGVDEGTAPLSERCLGCSDSSTVLARSALFGVQKQGDFPTALAEVVGLSFLVT